MLLFAINGNTTMLRVKILETKQSAYIAAKDFDTEKHELLEDEKGLVDFRLDQLARDYINGRGVPDSEVKAFTQQALDNIPKGGSKPAPAKEAAPKPAPAKEAAPKPAPAKVAVVTKGEKKA